MHSLGEISAYLAEIYGADVSKQTISTITDRVIVGMTECQNRPIYVALAVTTEGTRDILGLWAGEHGDGEGAEYWMRVLTEIRTAAPRDCLIVVCEGLKGLAEAKGAAALA